MPISDALFARTIRLALAAGFLTLLVVAGGAVWQLTRLRAFASHVQHDATTRTTVLALLNDLQNAETGQRGYLLTEDAAYLAPFEAAQASLPERLASLRTQMGTRPQIADLERVVGAKLAELRQTIALQQSGRHATALAIVRTSQGKVLMDQARAILETLIGITDHELADSTRALNRNATRLLGVLIAAVVLMAALAAGATWLVRRYTAEIRAARREVEASNTGLEERIRERTTDLMAANEEIQRFAYIVSHDLRSPLVNIMGFTSELEAGLEALRGMLERAEAEAPAVVSAAAASAIREDVPEAIGFIRTSTERMDRLINAILRLSREGRRTLAPARVRMSEMLTEIAGSVRHRLEEADATLEIAPDLPDPITDRLAIEQIFANLIDNAVKYLADGRPGRISVRGRREGRALIYEVTDNGRGIDRADLERIFDLFRRAGRQDKPGEGIGLAHVRALVRRLGGAIDCTSELGAGATFRVTLPAVLARNNGG